MAKTHRFTENATGTPVSVVVEHITKVERDEFSDCTTITLIGGQEIGVSESVEQVNKAVEGA